MRFTSPDLRRPGNWASPAAHPIIVVCSVHPKRLGMVGVLLCVLATLFAIEAKLAWYAPDGNHTIQISAAKLRAADAPQLIADAVASSHQLSHFSRVALLAVAVFTAPLRAASPFRNAPIHLPHSVIAGHSARLFLRPPPAR